MRDRICLIFPCRLLLLLLHLLLLHLLLLVRLPHDLGLHHTSTARFFFFCRGRRRLLVLILASLSLAQQFSFSWSVRIACHSILMILNYNNLARFVLISGSGVRCATLFLVSRRTTFGSPR